MKQLKSKFFIFRIQFSTVNNFNLARTEYISLGAVTEFKYSSEIGRAFRGHNELKWLKSWGPVWGLLPSKDALVFVDNHDNQRGHGAGGAEILTYKLRKMYVMAVAFMLAHPYGTPRIMSSFYFDMSDQGTGLSIIICNLIIEMNGNRNVTGPPANERGDIISPKILSNGSCSNGWVCEHRWKEIVGMIGFRNTVGNVPVTNWWDNDNNIIAFCRGNKGFVAFNNEMDESIISVNTCLPPGDYCDIINGKKQGKNCTGRVISVDGNGDSSLALKAQSVVAIHSEVGRIK